MSKAKGMKSPRFQLRQSVYEGHLIVITLIGDFNQNAVQEFHSEIKRAQSQNPQQIYIDLVKVSSIDCAAVGALASAYSSSRQLQIELMLVVTEGAVLTTLEMAGIKSIVPIIYSNLHEVFPLK